MVQSILTATNYEETLHFEILMLSEVQTQRWELPSIFTIRISNFCIANTNSMKNC
jgi:hypothetical protein